MSNRLFLDTSFVLALMNERDQYHAVAENISYKLRTPHL